ELYDKVKSHIRKYVDLAELDLDLCAMYVLFTWFYRKVNTVPYLRFLADTGKGKTRGKKVIGDLCFYPLYASGASSFSGIARTQQQWRGTLVIDEADFAGEKENQITKYLNLGFERGQYYILSDKQDPRSQDYFDAFSPKVLAMREPFHDNATEGRLLSITMHETSNLNIPIILSSSYYEESRVLRNELALFTISHWNDIDATKMMSFDDLDIEPRLKQLAMPLSIIFQLWPEGVEQFRRYLVARQQEVRRVRSMSWEGSLVNLAIAVATGDQEVGAEFGEYIKPGSDEPEAVTPSMVARQIKASVKAITQALTSVGFQVEKRWITLHKENKEVRKQVRAYTVPDSRTWVEITSRYYYAEDGNLNIEIPQCLQSSKYAPSAEASHPSQVSQKVPDQHELVTLETVVTRENTPHGNNNGNKPTYLCSVCGSNNWWRNNGKWQCGRCHPNPQGEELFRLDGYGDG
ncbi:TFIIB-type zinc finger domain-containing protein, partial [Chloroflexota bacterium]